MNHFLALILGGCCLLGAFGAISCGAQQVADRARTADQSAEIVVRGIKELAEFDDEALQDSEQSERDLHEAMDELSAGINSGHWPVILSAHEKLCAVESRTVHAVERAKARQKGIRELKERAERAKAAVAAASAAADANAAQVNAITDIGGKILSGVTGGAVQIPRHTSSPPSGDYTGEAITAGTSVLLTFLGWQGGKHLVSRFRQPANPQWNAPPPMARPNSYGHGHGNAHAQAHGQAQGQAHGQGHVHANYGKSNSGNGNNNGNNGNGMNGNINGQILEPIPMPTAPPNPLQESFDQSRNA